MKVVVTTGAIGRAKLQSNHHHQRTNIQFFYGLDALPVAQPTVSKHITATLNCHYNERGSFGGLVTRGSGASKTNMITG